MHEISKRHVFVLPNPCPRTFFGWNWSAAALQNAVGCYEDGGHASLRAGCRGRDTECRGAGGGVRGRGLVILYIVGSAIFFLQALPKTLWPSCFESFRLFSLFCYSFYSSCFIGLEWRAGSRGG